MISAADSPVIDEQTVQLLQQLCGHPLPQNFLRLMAAYPQILKTAGRSDSGSGSEGVVSQVELLDAADSLIEINREARLGTLSDPKGREFCWPKPYLVIGETGDGDYYCLDTSGEQQGVLQFLNQPAEFECVTESLEEFVEMLVLAFTEEDDQCLSDEDDADDEEDLFDEEDEDEGAR